MLQVAKTTKQKEVKTTKKGTGRESKKDLEKTSKVSRKLRILCLHGYRCGILLMNI